MANRFFNNLGAKPINRSVKASRSWQNTHSFAALPTGGAKLLFTKFTHAVMQTRMAMASVT